MQKIWGLFFNFKAGTEHPLVMNIFINANKYLIYTFNQKNYGQRDKGCSRLQGSSLQDP